MFQLLSTLCITISFVSVSVAGASYSSIVGYVLGFPFLNDTVLNETLWQPRSWYDYDDMNISDFMMYMFASFAKYGYVPPAYSNVSSILPTISPVRCDMNYKFVV